MKMVCSLGRFRIFKKLCDRDSNNQRSNDNVLVFQNLHLIQGIHPSIRGEVWEFLLGCYDPMSTIEEREEIRQRRR